MESCPSSPEPDGVYELAKWEDEMFAVSHVNGAVEQSTDDALPGLLEELATADREHPDVSVEHESGWALSVFPSRHVVLEDVEEEEDGEPRSTQMVSDGECLQAMRAVAFGTLDELDHATWEEVPSRGPPGAAGRQDQLAARSG